MKRALVTGGQGFVGRWLALELAYRDYDVVATDRADCDVRDSAAVQRLVRELRPDAVFHLAAQSSVSRSFANPVETFEINVLGTVGLMDALRMHAPGARVVIVSSAEVYGHVDAGASPVDESATLRPANPYAASKLSQEVVALQFARAFGMHVVIARCFTLLGPGQSPSFAIATFARQIAAISSGTSPAVLRVGNLEPVRDVVDVRDATRALVELAERGEPGHVYNICTGNGVSVRELVDMLVTASGVAATVEVDPERVRPVDTPWLVGCNAKIRAATGWLPGVPLANTLDEILADAHANDA